MTDYIKYNPLDESTFPSEGAPILCVVYDREAKRWGIDAGFVEKDALALIWNERFRGADIYWKNVFLPGSAQPLPQVKQFADAIAGGKEEA